jgi:hypothetical protein
VRTRGRDQHEPYQRGRQGAGSWGLTGVGSSVGLEVGDAEGSSVGEAVGDCPDAHTQNQRHSSDLVWVGRLTSVGVAVGSSVGAGVG